MSSIYKGETGEIEVIAETLVIRRTGMQARLNFGKDTPDRAIPLPAVRAVLLKEPGKVAAGALRLVLGTDAAPSEAKAQMDDYDAMTFTAKQADAFRALHQWLQGVAAKNHQDGVDFSSVTFDPGVNSKTRVAQAKQSALATVQDSTAARSTTKQDRFAAKGVRDDIAAAAGRMGWTLGGKREIKKLAEHVPPTERVEFIAQGTYGSDQGIVVLTDRRLLFVFHGLVRQAVEDFPLDRISSVQSRAGLVTGDLTVHASGNQAVIKQIVKADLKHVADALRDRLHAGSAPTPAPTPAGPAPATHAAERPPAPDVMDQLRRLGELHAAGILTDDEFAAKKTELLSRL